MSKTGSPPTETSYQAVRADELAQHSDVPGSTGKVKRGVVQLEFAFLSGETCTREDRAGVNRLIQQATSQIIPPLFEATFHRHRFGFRPQRRARQAWAEMGRAHADGYRFAVDGDLKSFFDTVGHDLLIDRLRRKIEDERVIDLIGRYLRAGVHLPDGSRRPTGVPQGSPLSPLLANVMLDDLDWELDRRGLRFARYADDFLIFVKSRRAAERVLGSVTRFVEGRLKLVVNPTKSRAAKLSQCTFAE